MGVGPSQRGNWLVPWSTSRAVPTGSRRCMPHWLRSLFCGPVRADWRLCLWGFAAYLFATWWLFTHRLDRFWLPLLPPLAVLAGLGADWARNRGWAILLGTIMTISLVTNLTYISTALAGLNEWTGDLVFLRRDIPRRWNAALARLDAELPADAHPLLVGQAAVYHLNHSVTFNTVFDPEIIEVLASGKSDQQFLQRAA